MVDRERMVSEFTGLVRIDSLSKNERMMADALKEKLASMGYQPYEDDAGEKIGGSAGNVVCLVKGTRNVPAVLLMAHMDTVAPGTGKKPVVEDNFIRSDGTTVLGSDDAAGIVGIFETLRVLKEDNIPHGDIYVAFTAAEETGLEGSKNLDYSKIPAKYGFVLDGGGPVGSVAVTAPSHNTFEIVINGKAAHAGLEPENGINAACIAADAISRMKLGRIDHETTANIGVIQGGRAANIVCDTVTIIAEARSRNEEKLDAQTAHMEDCFRQAVAKLGGSYRFRTEREYPAYNIKEDDVIIGILKKAAALMGITVKLEATGGGSDANIINGKGINGVDLGISMHKVHTVEEKIRIDDLTDIARFLVEIIKAVE